MGTPYLVMPSHVGWSVVWETGEIKQFHNKDGSVRKTVVIHNSYETTNHDKALQKKAEMEAKGFKNVKIYECIF